MTKRKPSSITNKPSENRILQQQKKKLNNLYNYAPTFALETNIFAWDHSVVFSFKVT